MSSKKKVVKKPKKMSKPKSKIKKKVTTLVINRDKWLRGRPGDGSLLNSEGKMCCLGFYCKALGIEPKYIRGKGMPDDLFERYDRVQDQAKLAEKLGWLVHAEKVEEEDWTDPSRTTMRLDHADSELCSSLASDNDDDQISDKEREEKVTRSFAKAGVKIKFTGPKGEAYTTAPALIFHSN